MIATQGAAHAAIGLEVSRLRELAQDLERIALSLETAMDQCTGEDLAELAGPASRFGRDIERALLRCEREMGRVIE